MNSMKRKPHLYKQGAYWAAAFGISVEHAPTPQQAYRKAMAKWVELESRVVERKLEVMHTVN